MNFTQTFEEAIKPNVSDEFIAYAEGLKKALQKEMPKSFVEYSISTLGGSSQPSISLKVLMGANKSEWEHGIPNNDRFYHGILLFTQGRIAEGDTMPEKFEVNAGAGTGSVHYDNHDNPYLAYERFKTGWRNFKAPPDKVEAKLIKYFKKAKKLMIDNIDLFKPEIQDLIKKKFK